MSKECTVSVFCTAYNHEKYIAQALDSFLAQKTDFPFEVLVTDDASTDATASIISRYAQEHPDIIRFFHQDKNLFSQGINIYEEVMYPNARGDFIAYCEGDDYWCHTDKLQRQVDFLRSNPDYSACVHNTWYSFCGTDRANELLLPRSRDRDVPFSTIISGMNHAFHTSSIVGRAEYMCSPPDFQRVAFEKGGFTDYAIALWLRINGKIRFIDEPMSVYRLNSVPESWRSGVDRSYRHKTGFVSGEIAMMRALLPHVQGEEKALVQQELLKREYELLYLEGRAAEMAKPPYDALFRAEPFSFRAKTALKIAFPRLHEAYRNSKGYKTDG